MLFIPFLFLLPFIVDGRKAIEICGQNVCLRYAKNCEQVWTVKTINESMEHSQCNLKEELNEKNPTEYSDDYLHLQIETVSIIHWRIAVFASKAVYTTFSIESPRLDLKMINKDKLWNLTVDGASREFEHNVIGDNQNVMTGVLVEIEENMPIYELFVDAKISFTINNDTVTYEDPSIWRLAGDRTSCSKQDIKPAFLIILIAYAVFSTIVALLLALMIYCISRDAKYKRVPTQPPSSSVKESGKEEEIPPLDPTTAGVKELTISKQTTVTDISRLKTESKVEKKI